MNHSLRGRLLWGIIGGMVVLLLVFSILLYGVIHKALMDQFDASLLSTARMLTAAIENEDRNEPNDERNRSQGDAQKETDEGESVKFDIEVQMIPEFNRVSASGFYQLQRQNGEIIARSPSLGDDKLPEIKEISEKSRYHKIMLPHHRHGRSVYIWFVPEGENNQGQFKSAKNEGRLLGLVVARDAWELHEQFMFLQLLFIGASAAVIVLSIGIGSWVVKTALRPLRHLAGDIAAVGINTLGNRLDLAGLPSEMVPVVLKLNDLLDRLKLSFERERCFTSDVAHELRTPLAGLRSTLEVALSRQRDWPACQESMSDCLDIARKMQELVDKLLDLARLDANQITLVEDTFSVAQLLEECWKPFAESACKRNIGFENQVSGEILCCTDKKYLAMAFTNLLENAADYTDTGGRIWIEGRESQQHITLTFANTGCNLSDEQAGQVFDRFWRADASRSDTGVHCGLGLALVEKIIRSLGGSIQVTSQGGIFLATLILSGHHGVSNE
jgi:two-component system, OmpR family, heavy metal sensor histidine kinase CusS